MVELLLWKRDVFFVGGKVNRFLIRFFLSLLVVPGFSLCPAALKVERLIITSTNEYTVIVETGMRRI